MGNMIAKATTDIQAPIDDVWHALTDPAAIKQYMMGATVTTDWHEGSPITWKGDFKGKPFEDKGKVLQIRRPHVLSYTHFSPLAGLPDAPENYHTVTVSLSGDGDRTHVSLTQDGNATAEAREHSEKNWAMMLGGLKKVVESAPST